ncbi:C2H2 transcription factor RfeC [Akanthomyces lecanii RCEF 1005]|uniref:C2H2 transcription factor RfeC n=1 Tax=Akanthomyces lecanii RCEF 1005 TaxID=1081108 RepID=A0A167XKW2_CORDF|nr:C2H2 transcription factor RfeC [Akanthomyces lecanii RCEF 1005]
MQLTYGSNSHTSRTCTPNMPNSVHNLSSGYLQSIEAGQRGGMYSMAQSPCPPLTSYEYSQPMMPGATTVASHSQPTVPAPPGGRSHPVLHSMPAGGPAGQNGYSPNPMMPQNGTMGESEHPSDVVGFQGRRGVLTSTPGRLAAPVAGTSATEKTVEPVKKTKAKVACAKCSNDYLSNQSLKRHSRHHEGTCHFECHHCHGAFNRSDVLQYHVEKCSIRQGNSTGVSHFS